METANSDVAKLKLNPLILLQWALMFIILAIAPIAMQFEPFKEIYEMGVWKVQHTADPLYRYRASIVIIGLVASGLSTLCSIGVLSIRRYRPHIASSFALALATLMVGWRAFPYWVVGVYNAMRGLSPRTDFDPKALIPMTWLGDLWRIPVLMLYLFTFLGVPTLLVVVRNEFVKKSRSNVLAIVTCIVIIVLAYIFTPNYFDWVMD